MLVSEAIEHVRDDTLETAAAGLATDTRIVRCLNEGIRHLHNLIANNDPAGEWLGKEASYTYPASTRWANLISWSGAGTAAPNRIISLLDVTTSTNPRGIEFSDARQAVSGRLTPAVSQYLAILKGDQLGLRLYGQDNPPSSAVPTRMIYIPAHVAITAADGAKVIGTDYPFPSDFAEAVVAYAVVRLIMQTEAPTNDWQARYSKLETALVDMLQHRRKQTFTQPAVVFENPWWA
jgi:hypothetical protein